jgi:hypothetical protein
VLESQIEEVPGDTSEALLHGPDVSVPGAEGEKEAEEVLDEVDPGPGPKDARPTRLKKKPAWLNDGNWQT